MPSGGQVWKYGGQLVIAHYVDGPRPRPNSTFTNLAMVAVFLNFELDLHLNLDLNLDSNKLDLGLGLELARGQRSGAPEYVLRSSANKIWAIEKRINEFFHCH